MLKKAINDKKGEDTLAIHQSALKRAKQNEKRSFRNLHVRSTVKSTVKKLREAVEGKDVEGAQKALAKVIPVIQKACTKGVYHRNTSSRKISRLTREVNALKGQ